MKKYLLLLLLTVTSISIFTGCGSSKNNLSSDGDIENTSTYDIDKEFEKAQKLIDEEASKIKNIGIDHNRIITLATGELENSFDFEKTFSQSNDVVVKSYLNIIDKVKLLVYFNKDDDTPFSALISTDGNGPEEQKSKEISSKLFNEVPNELKNYVDEIDLTLNDGRNIRGVKLVNGAETYSLYKDLNGNDTLSDENVRTDIDNFLRKLDFQGLKDYLNNYTKENSPSENDFSFDILNQIDSSKVLEVSKDLVIKKDDIEKDDKIYYKDILELSNSVHLSPYINSVGNLVIKTGFLKDNWLFSEKAILNLDSSKNIYITDENPNREVLDGGIISETLTDSVITEDSLALLSDFNQATIRFKGEHEDLDIPLNQDETQSLNTLSKLPLLKIEIKKIIDLYDKF